MVALQPMNVRGSREMMMAAISPRPNPHRRPRANGPLNHRRMKLDAVMATLRRPTRSVPESITTEPAMRQQAVTGL